MALRRFRSSRSWFLAGAALFISGVASSACSDDANCHGEECPSSGASGGAGTGGNVGGEGGSGEGGTVKAKEYCDCMLLSCHDAYHDQYGPESDEPAARAACIAGASMIPEAGMDVEAGEFIECRIHFCEAGRTDESVCPNTIGGVCE